MSPINKAVKKANVSNVLVNVIINSVGLGSLAGPCWVHLWSIRREKLDNTLRWRDIPVLGLQSVEREHGEDADSSHT